MSSPAVRTWRLAGERGDADLAVEALSADVQLISPITDQFRFVGTEQVHDLLRVALGVVTDIRYTDELSDGRTVALFYRGRVGDVQLEEAQRLRLDAEGLIREITLFLRPLPGLTALAAELGPRLARADGDPRLARTIRLAGGALHRMAASGERRLLPRAAPRRPAR